MTGSRQASDTNARRTGMTIIELLASTVLATLLMVAVLGVLQSMTRGQKTLVSDISPVWHARFVRQLQWDIANSHSHRTTADGFELIGFAGRSIADGEPLHCQTVVRYAVVDVNDHKMLLRQEIHTESLSLDNSTTNLICAGIERIVMSTAETVESSGVDVAASYRGDGPLPDRLRVSLYGAGETAPVVSRMFLVR